MQPMLCISFITDTTNKKPHKSLPFCKSVYAFVPVEPLMHDASKFLCPVHCDPVQVLENGVKLVLKKNVIHIHRLTPFFLKSAQKTINDGTGSIGAVAFIGRSSLEIFLMWWKYFLCLGFGSCSRMRNHDDVSVGSQYLEKIKKGKRKHGGS